MMHELLANLRRRPVGAAEFVADGLRVVALACIVVAGIGWGPMGAVSLAFVSGAMLLPRALDVRPAFDILYGVIALVSVWSSVTDLYVTVKWWDLPMHFLMNGLAAAIAYVLFDRLRIVADAETLPRPTLSRAIVTTSVGLAFGAFWEMFEWFGKNFIDDEIYVGYTDSIGDLVLGGLGSLLAGLSLTVLMARPHRATTPAAVATSEEPPAQPVA
jgi:hypothetical protein